MRGLGHFFTFASLLICLTKGSTTESLPRFQAYWESELSYLYNDDELNNPWHIDLGESLGPFLKKN